MRGHRAARMTKERRALLERIRREVEVVVEDIQATATSLESLDAESREAGPTERATLRLIREEQQRQQLELARLHREYDSLGLAGSTGGSERAAA